MKKVIFSIIFIVIIFMVILGSFYINKDKKFKATATVIDTISFSKIKVELKENNNSLLDIIFVFNKLLIPGFNLTNPVNSKVSSLISINIFCIRYHFLSYINNIT